MANVAHNLADPRRGTREEQYWSPSASLDRRPVPVAASETEHCQRCGTEFIIGSRFCYVCGSDRDLPGTMHRGSLGMNMKSWLDFNRMHQRIGGPAALIAFIVGAVCLFAAALTGVMFTATTMIDWQAVQLWRIEWLLAAIAAFVAGILLKKPSKPE
jgi:hypothetical protein